MIERRTKSGMIAHILCNTKNSTHCPYPIMGYLLVNDSQSLNNKTIATNAQWSEKGECVYWNYRSGRFVRLEQYDLIPVESEK